jgi:hypothetical protein
MPLMSLKNLLFVTTLLFVFFNSIAQRNYDEYNRMGVNVGVTFFDINTSDFNTEQGTGFIFGFTTRGSFRNKFDLIFGINYFNNSLGIAARSGADRQYVDYTVQGAQLKFLGSYNIIRHHLSLEFGPIFNLNSKMKLDNDRYENYIVEGYSSLRSQDIEDISKFHFHLAGGITGGMESIRITAQYQYGVTNIIKNLDDENLEKSNFKGNSSTIIIMAIIYF